MYKKTDPKEAQKNQRIQVFARCRPLNSAEKRQGSPSVIEVIPEKKEILVKDKNSNREFFFDKVFSPDTKQVTIYKAVVAPLIQEVLMGYNCTVFAYGQTGTGKTYTMEGERNNDKCSWEDDPGAGIIPRSLHQLFEELNKEEAVEFSVRVSFLELYNEELFDLLSTNESELSKLRLFEDSTRKGSVVIQGLEEVIVNSKDEVYSILEKGTSRRQTAATMLNASSSRSHTVFSVTIHIKENTIDGEELLKTGKLNLVDLAGSENVGRSGAVDKRAREAGNINQSLLTLGRVITSLIEKAPHVPYRESKLTRLLQDSLGGHTKTSIIATVSPALCNFDETLSTLDYATKAKSITIRPEVNQRTTKRALIREYTEEIERLRKDLVASRSKDGVYMDSDNYRAMEEARHLHELRLKELADLYEQAKAETLQVEAALSATRAQLHETAERHQQAVTQLRQKTAALQRAREVVSQTALQRDEKQYVIHVLSKVERELSCQARQLVDVADASTHDVAGLHAKIHRKVQVEHTNQEHWARFHLRHHRQSLTLDTTVHTMGEAVLASLAAIQADLARVEAGHRRHIEGTLALLREETQTRREHVQREAEAQTGWNEDLLVRSKAHKDAWAAESLEEAGSLSEAMRASRAQAYSDTHTLLQNIGLRVEELKHTTVGHTASIRTSLATYVDEHTRSLEQLQQHTEATLQKRARLHADMDSDLEGLGSVLTQLASYVTSLQSHHTHDAQLTRDFHQMQSAQESLSIHKKGTWYCTTLAEMERDLAEDATTSEQLRTLSDNQTRFEASDIQKHSELKTHLVQYAAQAKQMQELAYGIVENAIETKRSKELQLKQKTEAGLTEFHTSLGGRLKEDACGELEATARKAAESEQTLMNSCKDISQQIRHMDTELEKFVSEDLVKDVPTGTTPKARTYVYPRDLAMASPQERILQRFHATLQKDVSIAQHLPLDSSFDETEENKKVLTSPEAENADDVHNCSFTSDDSTSYDTDASSVSDVSVSSKDKENHKHTKKASRLPKKLPTTKVFLKPAIPPSRKPLISTNGGT